MSPTSFTSEMLTTPRSELPSGEPAVTISTVVAYAARSRWTKQRHRGAFLQRMRLAPIGAREHDEADDQRRQPEPEDHPGQLRAAEEMPKLNQNDPIPPSLCRYRLTVSSFTEMANSAIPALWQAL